MSNSGSLHWLMQRFSAIFLIFLSGFFSYKIFSFIGSDNNIMSIFNEPFTLFLFLLFFGTAFYHASLGIEVILEDYMPNKTTRQFTNFALKFLNFATMSIFIISIIYGYNKVNYVIEDKQDITTKQTINQTIENKEINNKNNN